MTIRPATKDDQELIRELWVEFEAELGGPEYLRESWEERGPTRPNRAQGRPIAEEDGRGRVRSRSPARRPKTAHVTASTCGPTRNKGIGRALPRGSACSAGLDHANFEVLIRNSDARRLYERLGFTPWMCSWLRRRGACRSARSDERPAPPGPASSRRRPASSVRCSSSFPGLGVRRTPKSRRRATAG